MGRRDEIVAAAIALLDRGEKVGVVSVAREIGIQPPSLYKHIESGAALDAEIAEEGFRRLAAGFQTALLKGNAQRRLETLLHLHRAFAHENRALYLHMSAAILDVDAQPSLALTGEFFGLLGPLLEAIGVPARDHVHAVRALRSGVHGFVLLELSGQFRMSADADETFAKLCRWLVSGLKEK